MAIDVVGLLERDHREVERMLASLVESEPGSDRETLVRQLAAALSLHMQFEEEHLYPVVEDFDAEAAEEANVEHQLAREGLQRLQEFVDAPGFGAAVEMLTGGIEHHVKDEETKVFPMLRERADADRLSSLANTLLDEKRAAGLSVPTDASKEELLEMARAKGIEGRSSMSKEELKAALETT